MSNVYDADFILFVVQVSKRRRSCRGPDILSNNVEYYLAFSMYSWSQFISTIKVSADFRSISVMSNALAMRGPLGDAKVRCLI